MRNKLPVPDGNAGLCLLPLLVQPTDRCGNAFMIQMHDRRKCSQKQCKPAEAPRQRAYRTFGDYSQHQGRQKAGCDKGKKIKTDCFYAEPTTFIKQQTLNRIIKLPAATIARKYPMAVVTDASSFV